jgi:hypothetical protein
MSVKRRAAVACMMICGLVMGAAPPAAASVITPAWTGYSPSYTVQQEGCGTVSGLTFKITCKSASGYDRAERRYATYTGSQRRFQGSFKITSMGGTRMSLKQTFHDGVGPFFLLAVENGGRLYSVEGGATIASGATVGTTVAVQTIHTIGGQLQVYINGSLKYSVSSPSGGGFYDKVGAYRTASGSGAITVVWSGLSFAYQ